MKRGSLWLLVLLFSVLLAGCGAEAPDYSHYSSPEKLDVTPVQTPMGTLYYQSRWDDWMVVTQEQEEEYLQVDFSAKLEDTEYPLFHVTIGKGRGSLVGQITDAEGTVRDVYIRSEEISRLEDLPEETQSKLYAMQEEINVLIEYLK